MAHLWPREVELATYPAITTVYGPSMAQRRQLGHSPYHPNSLWPLHGLRRVELANATLLHNRYNSRKITEGGWANVLLSCLPQPMSLSKVVEKEPPTWSSLADYYHCCCLSDVTSCTTRSLFSRKKQMIYLQEEAI